MKNLQAAKQTDGKVLQPKHPLGPHGYRAILLDSDGNRIALHPPRPDLVSRATYF